MVQERVAAHKVVSVMPQDLLGTTVALARATAVELVARTDGVVVAMLLLAGSCLKVLTVMVVRDGKHVSVPSLEKSRSLRRLSFTVPTPHGAL